MKHKDLSIIIVNWHSADYVLECVRSIEEHTMAVSYEVIVVDNASFDSCEERLALRYPDVIYVQSQFNLGFGRANNLGAEHSKGEVLLFLNPDTEVVDRAIERLYEIIQKLDKAGAVGCRILNSDGSLQRSCVQTQPTILNQVLDADLSQRLFPKSFLWGKAVLFKDEKAPAQVDVVSGACLMIRKNVFEHIGGFSTDYFMYAEDLDLCFKTHQANFYNYYINSVEIVHHGGGSSNQTASNFANIMMRESVFRLLRKTRGRMYSYCYRIALSSAALIRMALLGGLYPAMLSRRRRGRLNAAIGKWLHILRWGLGLEGWVRKYDQIKTNTIMINNEKRDSCAEYAEN
jgi:GT2 family glycosyltransferase